MLKEFLFGWMDRLFPSPRASVAPVLKSIPRPSLRPAPRVRTKSFHGIQFRMADAPVVAVENISISGVGLRRDDEITWPEPGTLLAGHLDVEAASFPVRIRVAHVSPGVVGGAFLESPRELPRAIHQHLRPELTGAEMVRVRSEALQKVADGTPHWFHRDARTELYFVEREGLIVRFHLAFADRYLEGGMEEPLRQGRLFEAESWNRDDLYRSGNLVRWESAVDETIRHEAIRLLSSIPELEDRHREALMGLVF